MFHIPQSRKFIIGVTVHLESFDGRYNETLVFYPLKVSNDAFDSSSMRGFWAVGESVILVHRIGNFGPSSFFLSFFLSLGLATEVPKLTHYGMVLFQTRA